MVWKPMPYRSLMMIVWVSPLSVLFKQLYVLGFGHEGPEIIAGGHWSPWSAPRNTGFSFPKQVSSQIGLFFSSSTNWSCIRVRHFGRSFLEFLIANGSGEEGIVWNFNVQKLRRCWGSLAEHGVMEAKKKGMNISETQRSMKREVFRFL